jgi:hypothetical protein
MAKKKASKKATLKHHVSQKALPPKDKEAKDAAALPPLEKEMAEIEEEPTKEKKDAFFDEEDLKEFSVKDEEEDLDEDSGGDGGEPAWAEEEY